MAQQVTQAAPASETLPADGMSRWRQAAPFMPFSREKFRQLVIAGIVSPDVVYEAGAEFGAWT